MAVVLVWGQATYSQNNRDNGAAPAPLEEKFVERSELVTSWLETDCDNLNRPIPDCNLSTWNDLQIYHRVSLYNANGSLWYEFSVIPRESDSFLIWSESESVHKIKKLGFIPYKTDNWNHRDAAATLILRLAGESPNWYAVEVNEQTKEIKYAPKHVRRMWAKTSWVHWLFKSGTLKFDGERIKLLDKPDGKIIEESRDLTVTQAEFVRANGEWAYVKQVVENKLYTGWIRWKDGRELLVGCILNDNKIPSMSK